MEVRLKNLSVDIRAKRVNDLVEGHLAWTLAH